MTGEKDKDIAERNKNFDDEFTTVFFQAFKKAEPIIILASISLAIGALVFSEKEKFLTIYNSSIISAFMFIFSFGSYVLYELSKKYWYPKTRISDEEYSAAMFVHNMLQFAPVYFVVIGMGFLLIIAYNFSLHSGNTETNTGLLNSIPIPNLTFLFVVIYFLIDGVINTMKGIIRRKKFFHDSSKFVKFLLTASVYVFFWFLLFLNILSQIITGHSISIYQSLLGIVMSIFVYMGFIVIIYNLLKSFLIYKNSTISRGKKRLAITLILLVALTLFLIYTNIYYLKSLGILNKNFSLSQTASDVLNYIVTKLTEFKLSSWKAFNFVTGSS